MGMKANEIGDWLRRQHAGKRDHHEALRDDYVVIRPGPRKLVDEAVSLVAGLRPPKAGQGYLDGRYTPICTG
jgi:hypothetical protein